MKKSDNKILFTGGSGLLGSEMKKIAPDFIFPSRETFDISNFNQMDSFLRRGNFNTIVHAAAFASLPGVEESPMLGIDINIIGTANIAKLCLKHDLRLIYLSTDYVFNGRRGNYTEDDPVMPINKYAWSKLGGECAVQLVTNSVIIRTSFGPKEFPHAKAFTDQWTSRETVDIVAKKIYKVIESDLRGIIHIGGARRTVYKYATDSAKLRTNPIGKMLRKDVNFNPPKDTSLSTRKFKKMI